MKRIGRVFFVGILILSLLTGCWNRRELNDLGILMGAAIDKVDKQYQVSVQVVIPDERSTRSTKGGTPVTMYKATAPTLFEAFRKLTETSPRKIYTGHIRVLVLSESVARDGIAKVLDLLTRNPESTTDYYVTIANGTSAENVLKILTPLQKVPADAMFDSLETSATEWAPTTAVTVDQLIDQMMTEGMNPVLTGIKIIKNKPVEKETEDMKKIDFPVRFRYSGLAVFKKDKLIGWLNANEGKGYNYITNNVKSTVGVLECPDGKLIALEVIRSHTNVKGRIVRGKPLIEIQLKMQANIGEVACSIDINDKETIKMLQKKAERKLEYLMEQTVEVMQHKYKVDIFGFGQAIYRSDPKAWKKMKADWDEQFAALKVEYKMEVHIRNIGTTSKSIERSIKEK